MENNLLNFDKNLINSTIKEKDVIFYNALSSPFEICGLYYDSENKVFHRLPKEVTANCTPAIKLLSKHTSGGRLRFKTNTPYIALKVIMPVELFGSNLSLLATFGFSVYSNGVFCGNVRPEMKHYSAQENGYFNFEGVIKTRKTTTQDIEIYFPTYGMVSEVFVGLKEGSTILPPSEYEINKPIVFYGSSTTQGACASRSGNDYASLLSRWFNADYINLGFSGNGNGDEVLLNHLITLDASVYVLDYGMNVKDLEWLKNNHYPFYEKLRKEKPTTPIVFLTRTFYNDPDKFLSRHEIAKETYKKALENGDKNIYFFDGTTLRNDTDFDYGTTDNAHPNDVGFYKTATAIKPIFDKIFNKI